MGLGKDMLHEELLSSLTPIQKALLSTVKNIYSLEKEFSSKPDQKLSVGWTYLSKSVSTGKLLEEILGGNISALPLTEPNSRYYEEFKFLIHTDNKTLGFEDVRIKNKGDHLLFQGNVGTLKGTEEIWERMLGSIDFPIEIVDMDHNIFRNPARVKQATSIK